MTTEQHNERIYLCNVLADFLKARVEEADKDQTMSTHEQIGYIRAMGDVMGLVMRLTGDHADELQALIEQKYKEQSE